MIANSSLLKEKESDSKDTSQVNIILFVCTNLIIITTYNHH